MERLVGDVNIRMKKKTLKTAASITIATWLDEIHELQRKIKCGQTENIAMGMAYSQELREADE